MAICNKNLKKGEKSMKKIISAILCAALCLCMALPVFAAGTVEGEYPGQSNSTDVKITIGGAVVHVYSVDIEFNNATFTYSSDSYKWNPDNYTYEHDADAAWNGNGTVKVINHSDLKIDYSITAENVVSTYGPLNIVLDGSTAGTIEACTVDTTKGSKNATATYTVTGTPTTANVEAQKLGEIKVTISK